MKAAYVENFCDATGIQYGDLPDPVPGAGEVLVEVEATGVDMVDTFVRSGAWRTEVSFPLALGRDLVGTIAAAGPGVGGLAVGDRVWTNSAGYGGRPGATAEFAVVPRDRLYRLPAGADPMAFVAALHPGATAHGALAGLARVQPGETVVVIGGNGAVGMCLVQLAAARGARVIAVVREERAAGALRQLGAQQVTVSPDAGQALAGARANATDGVDVVVDTTGRADFSGAPGLLNQRGRIVLVAGSGRRIELDQWRFYLSELQLLGFIMSGMTVTELADAAEWINTRPAANPLTVSVGQVLGFADAAEAHAMLERRELPRMADGTVGRLVLRP
ncbi:MAG TPA: NADPH:quinone reductase [Streptosporangiaceae bacterium]|jgi:NADPH:quinone reductase-like Zn-dependent oxidoreductase